jgi:hypothetical protein
VKFYGDCMLHHSSALPCTSFFTRNFFCQKSTYQSSPPILLTYLSPWYFPVSLTEDTAIVSQLRWWKQNCKRCWTPSQNASSRMHLKIAEALGVARTFGAVLLRG